MNEQPGARMSIDPEMLAAYIDKRLTPEQRAAVEAQLAADPQSYELLVESMRALDAAAEQSAPIPMPVNKRKTWVIAASALAAAAVIALAVWVSPQVLQRLLGDRVDPRFEKLVAAVGEQRYVEPRVTGGFHYGPLKSATRNAGESSENLALLAAAGEIQKLSEQNPTPGNLHAWGVSQLMLGRYDDAVQTLESAIGLDANDAASQSDLAAAYAARAAALERDDDWPRALAAAERSLRLNPALLEAQFNRALALQQLHLSDAAARAWDEYLANDNSPWRAAATQLRQQIGASNPSELKDMIAAYVEGGGGTVSAQKIVSADSQKARELFEDQLLTKWAESVSQNVDAAPWMRRAEGIADALSDAGVDKISSQTVRLMQTGSHETRQALVTALLRWRDGRALYARNEMAKMTAVFDDSAALLTAAGSPMALWARHFVVVGEFYAGKLQTAEQLCRQLIDVATKHGYRPLRARLMWDLGTIAYQSAKFEDALSSYREAETEFESLGEHENAAAMEQLTAESMARLGEPLGSWKHHRKALNSLNKVTDPRRRHTILAAAGHSALNLGMPEAAYYLFDAAVPNALVWNTPVPIVEALLNRARASVAMGHTNEADADLLDAERHLADMTDPSMQTRYAGDLLLAKAEARLEGDPAAARQAAMAAVKRAEVLSSEYRLAALRLLEGRAAVATGDLPAARESLEAGVEALESKRALVQQRALRVSYLDSVWDVYAELIRLEALSANDPVKALTWVERSRARMVLDELGGPQPSWDIGAIQKSLKPDQGILYLEAHPKIFLEWLVTSNEIVFKQREISEDELKRFVSQYRAALQTKDMATARSYSRVLYNLLIEPVGLRGRGLATVAFAPDATLEAVPFSALQDAEGEYVADWLVTSVVPSGSVLRALGAAPRTYRRATAIGQPVMTPSVGRMLPPLPDASAEMNEIAALYPKGTVIRRHEATAAALMKALSEDDVVQFSGHALANPGVAWQARLILSPNTAEDSGVFSLESLKPRSVRANTVVLAACGTGLGGMHRGEGLLTLGRPLLAAGARAVVVSLWNVDDRAMRAVTTSFHKYLATSQHSPAAALQLAQRSLMKSKEFAEPWAWAALNVQGALD